MIKNLELFKVFYYVASTGSLTKAASELSITQPAVSQAMKQLETSLNVKLFKRSAKGIILTNEGETLFSYVSKGYESIEQGVNKLHGLLNLEDGIVNIGADDYGIKYYLLTHLDDFKAKYPGIKLNIIPMSDDEIESSLEDGTIDIGITMKDCSNHDNLEINAVDSIDFVFAAGTNYTYLSAPMLPIQLLSHLPLISGLKDNAARVLMDSFLCKSHISVNPSYEIDSADMILQYAINNLGVAFLPKEYTTPYSDNSSLIVLSLSTDIPSLPLFLINRAEETSKAALALINLLVTEEINK